MFSRSILFPCVCLLLVGLAHALITIDVDRAETAEQALIVKIKLEGGHSGSREAQRISDLEDQLEKAIKTANVGEFDGDEFGDGFCAIYMYGPDAEKLAAVTLPILKTFHPPAGSFVIKRYGQAGAKQERLELSKE